MKNIQRMHPNPSHRLRTPLFMMGLIGLFVTLITLNSQAAPLDSDEVTPPEALLYDVEIIVFASDNETRRAEEDWPTVEELDLSVPENFVQYKYAITDQAITEVQSGDEFNSFESKLVRRNKSRILFKRTWQQRIYNDQMTTPWYIKGGKQNEGIDEFEGYLKISVRRYLHVDLDLRLHRIGVPVKPASLPEELQFLQTQSSLETSPLSVNLQMGNASTDAETSSSKVQILDTVQLKQRRRMRSKEIHYIDHPLMGVLVRISPVKTGMLNPELNPS